MSGLGRPPNRLFWMVPRGRYRRGLEEYCKSNGLEVGFETYAEREELARRLADSDVGLVTQKRETLGCVVPSKTYGIMAAGRGVLFVGPGEATTARMIHKFGCGWHVECGDSDGLVALLQRLAERPELVRDAGRKAREAFVANYDIAQGVGRVCDALGCSGVERVVSATGRVDGRVCVVDGSWSFQGLFFAWS